MLGEDIVGGPLGLEGLSFWTFSVYTSTPTVEVYQYLCICDEVNMTY